MNAPSNWVGSVASLADGSTGLMLVAKCTLLLALAWLGHAALAGRNPRWRVALWRGAMLGVGLIVAFSHVPPIVRYPIGPPFPQHPVQRQEPLGAPFRVEPRPPTAVVSPPVPPRTMERISIAPVAQIEHSPDQAAIRRLTEPVPTPAPSVVAEPLPSRVFRLARSWTPSIWLAGMLVLTARLILAARVLDRLVRRSSDVPDDIARECRAIAAQLGCAPAVRVVRSAEVATPCLAGLLRPVLLLPGAMTQGQDDLPAILAHELAHARHHDLAWNLAAHLASVVLWFHPLAWRIRSGARRGLRRRERRRRCRLPRRRGVVRPDPGAAGAGRGTAGPGSRAGDGPHVGCPPPPRGHQPEGLPEPARLEACHARRFLVGGLLSVLIAGFGFTRAAGTPPSRREPSERPGS